jgi:hypothetical protein
MFEPGRDGKLARAGVRIGTVLGVRAQYVRVAADENASDFALCPRNPD